ncbi:MAG: DUF6242 domain-containing protein [Candidatus Symbiothrix sp.]|nr:DUF6242 domain-containing protein [Candidatus Symbiothrix sp.]
MKFKIGAFLLLLGCISSSCLKSNNTTPEEDMNAGNAQILTLSLANDSLPALAKVKFSINQITSEVYNHDSLPYLTDVSKLVDNRVKVTYASVSGYATMATGEGSTLKLIASGDSLTIAINAPVSFDVYAGNGTKKSYALSVNVHQIDPDSVQYQLFTGTVPVVSAPSVVVKPSPLPNNFPTSGYDSIYTKVGTVEQLTLIGGTSANWDHLTYNTVWMTEDGGQHWVEISQNSKAPLPKMDGGNAFLYNGEIWFINGQLTDNTYNTQVYYSVDRGVSWKVKPSKAEATDTFTPRKHAKLIVDAQGRYFYIIGGQTDINTLTDVWQCALNARL